MSVEFDSDRVLVSLKTRALQDQTIMIRGEVEERAGVWVVYDKSHCLYCVVRTETRLK